MAPFDLSGLSALSGALVFGAVGFAFGAVLELAGFGDSRKLAAQFYLRDLTVLKTMFTAIVVAAVLIFLASGVGALDLSRVFVNPTYLWPGIVGGLIMGVGFVVGGFCPGTSLVAAATLKVDGIFFVAGGLTGVWIFGESVSSFEPFWLSSAMGRFTLPDWLGLSVGATVLLVVLMAVLMFWGAEKVEARFAPASVAAGKHPAAAATPARRRGGRPRGRRGDRRRRRPAHARPAVAALAEAPGAGPRPSDLRGPGRGRGAAEGRHRPDRDPRSPVGARLQPLPRGRRAAGRPRGA